MIVQQWSHIIVMHMYHTPHTRTFIAAAIKVLALRVAAPRKMTKTQCAAKGLGPVLAMAALFLLAPSLVNGLHCPLPVSNSKL